METASFPRSFAEDVQVQSPSSIRDRLSAAAMAAFLGDAAGLDAVQDWLERASGRDLLRIDGVARQYRYDGPLLGRSEEWTRPALERSVTTAALASMHNDGFLRERAVRELAASDSDLSNRMLALRADDHVALVRALVSEILISRSGLHDAASIMPVLNRLEPRGRGAETRARYLETVIATHGITAVFEQFRVSADRDLRRAAFRSSLELDLLDTAAVVDLLPLERDQVVRRLLAQLVASNADHPTIRALLLNAHSAESRALALVKLDASELDGAEVEPLLVDSSVLVRSWARRRWEEMGRDVVSAYWEAARSAPKPVKRAVAYVGLTEVRVAVDRTEVLDLVHSDELALRKVGLQLLVDQATVDDVPEMLDYVRSDNTRIARLASDVLARNSGMWSIEQLAGLKGDPDPDIRRRAWWLHRSRRGWEAPIADLELLSDRDHQLALLGRRPVAPMYLPPSEAQRQRIAELLPDAPLGRDQRLGIAWAAGLNDLVVQFRAEPRWPVNVTTGELPITVRRSPSRWRRLLGRRDDRGERRETTD
jgi:hypothetical protein